MFKASRKIANANRAVINLNEFKNPNDVDYKSTFSSKIYIKQMSKELKDIHDYALEKYMRHVETAIDIIEEEDYDDDKDELLEVLECITFLSLPEYKLADLSITDFKLIHRSFTIVLIKCNFAGKLYTVYQALKEKESIGYDFFELRYMILNLYTCYSDISDEFSYDIVSIKDMVNYFLGIIKKFDVNNLHELDEETKSTEVLMILAFIYNLLIHDKSRKYAKENYDIITIMKPFTTSNIGLATLSSTFSISYLADENQSQLFSSKSDGIIYALNSLRSILKMNDDVYNDGWTSFELAKGIGRLAINDSNKKLLVNNGCLEPLFLVAQSSDDEEAFVACEALWNIAFMVELRKEILKIKGLKEKMEELSKTERPCQIPAQGLLWLLKQEENGGKPIQLSTVDSKLSETENVKSKKQQDFTTAVKARCGHVMLSYQWDNQEMVKHLNVNLKKLGYNVWIDLERMNGSILQAMSEAVEQSKIIIVCMSQKYKESANCRMEAEYTVQCKKEFIPLIMENSYKPDGWLGLMLGAKLFYDFSGKYDINEKFQELLGALGEKGKHKLQAALNEDTIIPETALMASAINSNKKKLTDWNERDVEEWIDFNKLDHLEKLKKLNGKTLSTLKVVYKQAPERFYKLIGKELDIYSLDSISDFLIAFQKL